MIKKREKKTLELIDNGKQSQLEGVPETVPREKKKGTGRASIKYWRCKRNHIFFTKFKLVQERIDELRCPTCGAGVKNQSNKSTYLFYLHNQGRGNEKSYRTSTNKLDTKKRA